jgi:uncharacterized repeat protein (TIGR01451 family)
VTGTSNYLPVVVPGDQLTYTIFFANTGLLPAAGTTLTVGPAFTDNIPASTTLGAGSPAFTCCANPASTTGATITTTTGAVKWVMQAPLPVSSTGGIQGNFTLQVKIN